MQDESKAFAQSAQDLRAKIGRLKEEAKTAKGVDKATEANADAEMVTPRGVRTLGDLQQYFAFCGFDYVFPFKHVKENSSGRMASLPAASQPTDAQVGSEWN